MYPAYVGDNTAGSSHRSGRRTAAAARGAEVATSGRRIDSPFAVIRREPCHERRCKTLCPGMATGVRGQFVARLARVASPCNERLVTLAAHWRYFGDG